MTAALDTQRRRRILMIAANPAISPVTGWPVGFWWAELTHPYRAFTEAGYEVEIASPAGGDLQADSFSDPADPSGYAAEDLLSLGFKASPRHSALLRGTRPVAAITPGEHDAVFVVGGQSPMVTMIDDAALHAFLVAGFEAGRILALVCHATCVLLKARRADGTLLVKGRTWTGFADAEEDFADGVVGRRIQPFRIEQEARRLPDTNFIVRGMFQPFALRDGSLITGQQQHSGAAAAALVIEALGR
jgi:putative intracellular protease/amidase